jgi:hypothetical protein
MSGGTTGARVARTTWMVQGDAVLSGDLLAAVAGDPQVRVVEHVANDLVVIEMTRLRADELKARFGRGLVVEPDQAITRIDPMTPDD